MKKYLQILFLTLCAAVHAQAPLNFSARLNVTNVTGSDPYTVTGVVQSDLGIWNASNLNVTQDSVYHLEGADLLIYRIVSITSASGNNFVMVLDDIDDSGNLPSTGTEWCALQFTTNFQFSLEVGNLPTNLKAAIDNRFKQRLDAAMFALNKDLQLFSTSDTLVFSPSGKTPVNGDFALHTLNGCFYERKNGFWNQRTGKNGELVLEENRKVIAYGSLGVQNYNLNQASRFYTVAFGDVLINSPINLVSQKSGDIFVFEVKNETEDQVAINFNSFVIKDFNHQAIPDVNFIDAGSTKIFTFRVVKVGELTFLVSRDDLSAVSGVTGTSGSYTPTIVASDTLLTNYPATYTIVDSVVTVIGLVRIGNQAGSLVSSITISLPPGGAKNFTAQYGELRGKAEVNQSDALTTGLPRLSCLLSCDFTNDLAFVSYEPIGSGGVNRRNFINYSFSYKL